MMPTGSWQMGQSGCSSGSTSTVRTVPCFFFFSDSIESLLSAEREARFECLRSMFIVADLGAFRVSQSLLFSRWVTVESTVIGIDAYQDIHPASGW